MRPPFSAVWKLDLAFADVVATSSDPRVGAIRMAWWRERLEELDHDQKVPAEPRLQGVATELLPRGITGEELSRLEDGWLPLLEPFPWTEKAAEGLRLRGRILFGIGARLIGGDGKNAEAAGALWSLADGAQHCSDAASRDLLASEARAALKQGIPRAPRIIRPLTVLAALAAADLNGRGNLGRLAAAARHRTLGTFPR